MEIYLARDRCPTSSPLAAASSLRLKRSSPRAGQFTERCSTREARPHRPPLPRLRIERSASGDRRLSISCGCSRIIRGAADGTRHDERDDVLPQQSAGWRRSSAASGCCQRHLQQLQRDTVALRAFGVAGATTAVYADALHGSGGPRPSLQSGSRAPGGDSRTDRRHRSPCRWSSRPSKTKAPAARRRSPWTPCRVPRHSSHAGGCWAWSCRGPHDGANCSAPRAERPSAKTMLDGRSCDPAMAPTDLRGRVMARVRHKLAQLHGGDPTDGLRAGRSRIIEHGPRLASRRD